MKRKRYSTLKIFKVEVVEVVKMVEVVKAVAMKDIIRRRDSRAKQIVEEEDVVKDTIKDIILTFSAISVKNMVTLRMIVTSTNVTIMVEWGILQEIVELTKRWKKRST